MLGLLADALNSAYQYANKPGPAQGKYNPVLGLLADALPIKAAANVLDDLSYGHAPIRGRGMTTQLTPDAKEVALALAPFPRASAGAALAGMGAVDAGVGKAVFLPNTPLKPNPLVGTRYDRRYVGGLLQPVPINPEAMRGGSVQIMPWDSTHRNFEVRSISDVELPRPVLSTGGQGYARDIKNQAEGIAGASNEEIAKRIVERANIGIEENLNLGGNGRLFQLPSTMGAKAEDFSTMPVEALMGLAQRANLTSGERAQINQAIQDLVIAKMVNGQRVSKQPFKNFAGILTDEGQRQMMQGTGMPWGTPGELRKAITNRLTMKGNGTQFQQRLGYNEEDLRAAFTDPYLAGVPKGYAGNTVIDSAPFAGIAESAHPAYGYDFFGRYMGGFGNVPVEHVMPKTWRKIEQEFQGKPGDMRTNIIGALEKRKDGISELVDDEVINSIGEYLHRNPSSRLLPLGSP